jgi:SAM-dependent methyltransferase
MDIPQIDDDVSILKALENYKFYHTIPLNERISTPGVPSFIKLHSPIYRQMGRVNFSGKRVLDIGCRDGLFAFEAERRGAAEIKGIDSCLSIGAVEFLIPFFKSKVIIQEKGLFDLHPETDGVFDIIMFAGVLYHLRYPFNALKIISDLLKPGGTLILETGIFADFDMHALLHCPSQNESPYDTSSVSFFNRKGMIDSLASFGLKVEETDYINESDRIRDDWSIIRGTFRCIKDDNFDDKNMHTYWNGNPHKTWQK